MQQGQRAFGFPASGVNVRFAANKQLRRPVPVLACPLGCCLGSVRLLPTQCACCRCSTTWNPTGRAEEEATVAQEELLEAATEAEETEAGEVGAAEVPGSVAAECAGLC